MGKLWEPSSRYTLARANNYRKNNFRSWDGFSGRKLIVKIFWQTIASVMIFFLVVGVFQVQTAWGKKVQSAVRNCFTEDYNIESVIKLFSAVGLWGDTFDRAALEVSQMPPDELVVPVSGQIIRTYGWEKNSEQQEVFSDGILIAAAEGTPVRAAMAGKVSRIAHDEELGRILEITDEKGYIVTYGHCKEILVNLEDEVTPGQIIAKVGQTGRASNAQLYLRIVKDNEAIDPTKLFLPTSAIGAET
ncbi:MAG: M23 family metallopeptidase [Peptococcia bacterium]